MSHGHSHRSAAGLPVRPENHGPLSIEGGGTGSTSATEARKRLDVPGLHIDNVFTGVQTFDAVEVGAGGLDTTDGLTAISSPLTVVSGGQIHQEEWPTSGTLTFARGTTAGTYVVHANPIDLTAQAAAIGATNLVASASGAYRVGVYLEVTTADVTAGTLDVVIRWTDRVGATSRTIVTALSMVATGRDYDMLEFRANSAAITYEVNVTGAVNAARFAVTIRTEPL